MYDLKIIEFTAITFIGLHCYIAIVVFGIIVCITLEVINYMVTVLSHFLDLLLV